MEMKNNIPEIRFKGFSDEWEKCDLSHLVDLRSGRDYKHLSNGNIPVYGTGGYMLSVNEALSYGKDAVGIGRKGTINKPYILKAPFWTVDTLFYAIPKEKNNLGFIYDIFQKIPWKQKDESTGVPSLSKIIINEIQVFNTKSIEQSKIGNYFQKLDKLISLNQQKYKKLVILKKAMLEKMFPKNGTLFPEIRFKGFSYDWEEKKLNILADVRDGTHDSPQYTSKGYPFVTSKNVKDGKINYDDIQYISDIDYEKINKRSKVDKNDILMGMIGTIGNIALIRKNPDFAIKNVALIKDTQKVYYLYLFHYLQSSVASKQLEDVMDGGTQKFISLNKIRDLSIILPDIKEQHQIGYYFEYLDKIISLHQQELEKLKNIKKAMLEKMFV